MLYRQQVSSGQNLDGKQSEIENRLAKEEFPPLSFLRVLGLCCILGAALAYAVVVGLAAALVGMDLRS